MTRFFDLPLFIILERLRRTWLSMLLVAVIIGSIVSSLNATPRWRDHEPLVWCVLFGAAYGVLLAASRFRARAALILAVLTSSGAVILIIGRVVPSLQALSSLPFADNLRFMNIRILTQLQNLEGELLLRLAMGWVAWNACVWLVWCVTRRKRALEGLVPCAVLLVLGPLLNNKEAALPIVFIICSVLLIARTAYTQKLNDWQSRRMAYPELIFEDWVVNAALVSLIVVMLAWLSTPEVRRSIKEFLDSFASAAVAPTRPVGTAEPIASASAARVPDLSRIGLPIPDSNETVMWVKLSDPPPPPEEAGPTAPQPPRHYWRSDVFTTYNGSGWERADFDEITIEKEKPFDPVAGRYVVAQIYELVAPSADTLFAVNTPITAGADIDLRIVAPGGDALARGSLTDYEVWSWATRVSVAELDADSIDYPPEIRAAYLQLPASLPQRVRDLAARITAGSTTPFEKAIRIQDYLRQTYPYNLDVPLPNGVDAVDYFLFDVQTGFCSYYASALAVMLRTQGVPARVVVGFAMGLYDFSRGAYRVPASASHAWVEVYFPSYGWVEFEPTAALDVFTYEDEITSTLPERTPIVLPVLSPELETLLWLAVLIVLVVFAVSVFYYRRAIAAQHDLDGQSRALYWQMRRALAQTGLGASLNITPHEFLALGADRLSGQPRLRDALERITSLYIRAVYARSLLTPLDLRTSRTLWRRARPEWLRLRLRASRRPRRIQL